MCVYVCMCVRMSVSMYVSGIGVIWFSSEFRLFDGPRGHSRDSSKLGENLFLCVL